MKLEYEIGVEDILRAHDMTMAELRGKRRTKQFVSCRGKVASYLLGRGWSRARIGRYLGYADHTSVLNLLRRYAA